MRDRHSPHGLVLGLVYSGVAVLDLDTVAI